MKRNVTLTYLMKEITTMHTVTITRSSHPTIQARVMPVWSTGYYFWYITNTTTHTTITESTYTHQTERGALHHARLALAAVCAAAPPARLCPLGTMPIQTPPDPEARTTRRPQGQKKG